MGLLDVNWYIMKKKKKKIRIIPNVTWGISNESLTAWGGLVRKHTSVKTPVPLVNEKKIIKIKMPISEKQETKQNY